MIIASHAKALLALLYPLSSSLSLSLSLVSHLSTPTTVEASHPILTPTFCMPNRFMRKVKIESCHPKVDRNTRNRIGHGHEISQRFFVWAFESTPPKRVPSINTPHPFCQVSHHPPQSATQGAILLPPPPPIQFRGRRTPFNLRVAKPGCMRGWDQPGERSQPVTALASKHMWVIQNNEYRAIAGHCDIYKWYSMCGVLRTTGRLAISCRATHIHTPKHAPTHAHIQIRLKRTAATPVLSSAQRQPIGDPGS